MQIRCIAFYVAPDGAAYEKDALYDVDEARFADLAAWAPGHFVVEKKTLGDSALAGLRERFGKPLEGPPADQSAAPEVVRDAEPEPEDEPAKSPRRKK